MNTNDFVNKILFIAVYGMDIIRYLQKKDDPRISEIELALERTNLILGGREKVKLDKRAILDEALSLIIRCYKNRVNFERWNDSPHRYSLHFPLIYSKNIKLNDAIDEKSKMDIERQVLDILYDFDILDFKYYRIAVFRENGLDEINWKLDALKLYLGTDRETRLDIIDKNQNQFNYFVNKKQEAENKLIDDCNKEKEQREIWIEQLKIVEKNKKKQIREKARRQIELQNKIESHELFGEILYRGVMYTVKSKSDIENFLKNSH